MSASIQAFIRHTGGDLDLRSAYSSVNGEGYALTNPESLIKGASRKFRRTLVNGPFSHGSVMTMPAVMDNADVAFTVLIHRMTGTHAAIQSDIAALVNAVSEYTWELHLVLDGVEWAWKCWIADVDINLNRKAIHAKSPEVVITTQRSPVALAGPI